MNQHTENFSSDQLKKMIVDIPDFPEKGIVFKDITPILLNVSAFESLIERIAESVEGPVDKIAAIESRGFLLGAPLARRLSAGMVLVRKKGKLPRETISESYGLEYGQDCLEIQKDDIKKGDRVLIVDDVLATGGTARAAENLCKELGAEVVGHRFIMDLAFLEGSKKLQGPSKALMSF